MATEADLTIVYGGRWQSELPAERGLVLLDEWQVLPRDLERALDEAAQLIVLDPLSFPFEYLAPRLWDVPTAISLPGDLDGRELQALLGGPVLSRLGFHDRLIGAGDRFHQLARAYHLPQASRLECEDDQPATAVLQLVDQIALHREAHAQLEARSVHRRDTWVLRTRAAKSAFNVEAGAAAEELARVAATLPLGTSGQAVVLGCGSGEWLMVAQRAGFEVTAFDLSRAAVERARFNYPSVLVRHPGLKPTAHDLAETADVALIAGTLGSLNHEARLRMLAWMWSMLRPGGWLLVLDDCVGDRGGAWIPVTDLTACILEATANHAVLDNARALRLEGESFHRVGLITYAKLGAAERL